MLTAPLPLRTPDSLPLYLKAPACLPLTPSNLFSQEVQMTLRKAKWGKGPEM